MKKMTIALITAVIVIPVGLFVVATLTAGALAGNKIAEYEARVEQVDTFEAKYSNHQLARLDSFQSGVLQSSTINIWPSMAAAVGQDPNDVLTKVKNASFCALVLTRDKIEDAEYVEIILIDDRRGWVAAQYVRPYDPAENDIEVEELPLTPAATSPK